MGTITYNKDNKDFKFSYLKTYDVSKIKKVITNIENEWNFDTSRQEVFDEHKYTHSYIINKVVFDEIGWQIGQPLIANRQSHESSLNEFALNIAKDLEKKLDGTMGQVLYIKLDANKKINEHMDSGDYLFCVARHHIPIITNPKVNFIVDKESKHIPEGECWEINNNKLHAVENNGDEYRIHLLIDIVPNKYIKGQE